MADMITRYYRFGNLIVRFDGPDFHETGYLSAFRCEPCLPSFRYKLSVVDSVPVPDGPVLKRLPRKDFFDSACLVYDERSGDLLLLDEELRGGVHHVQLNRAHADLFGSNVFLSVLDLPRRVIDLGGIFLHASYIDIGGEAIAFTAPKCVGKSTQAALWNRFRGAQIVNGDRALLWKLGDRWCACGSPYCGTSKISRNVTLPLKAVVILGQAPENVIRKAGPREAFAALLNGCSYDARDPACSAAAISLMERVIAEVPFLRLDCVPDESAVRTLEEFL